MNAVLSTVPVALAFFVGYGLLRVSRFLREEAAVAECAARGRDLQTASEQMCRCQRLTRWSEAALNIGLLFIAGSTVYAAAVFIVAIVGTVA